MSDRLIIARVALRRRAREATRCRVGDKVAYLNCRTYVPGRIQPGVGFDVFSLEIPASSGIPVASYCCAGSCGSRAQSQGLESPMRGPGWIVIALTLAAPAGCPDQTPTPPEASEENAAGAALAASGGVIEASVKYGGESVIEKIKISKDTKVWGTETEVEKIVVGPKGGLVRSSRSPASRGLRRGGPELGWHLAQRAHVLDGELADQQGPAAVQEGAERDVLQGGAG
jgi:hypothetical protein